MAERLVGETINTSETLSPYTPLEGAQLRLLLGGSDINPQKEISSDVSVDSISDFAGRDYSILQNASTYSRLESIQKQVQEGSMPVDFQMQRTQWVENVGKVLASSSHKAKIEKLAPFFAKIGINADTYNAQTDGMGLYNKYFSDRSAGTYTSENTSGSYISSNIKQFVQDVISTHTLENGTVDQEAISQRMNEYRWFAKIFGGQEVQETIAQMIDAEALAQNDKSRLVVAGMKPQSDGKPRASSDHLTEREKEILGYVWEHGKPRIVSPPITPTEPAPTVVPASDVVPPTGEPGAPSIVIPSAATPPTRPPDAGLAPPSAPNIISIPAPFTADPAKGEFTDEELRSAKTNTPPTTVEEDIPVLTPSTPPAVAKPTSGSADHSKGEGGADDMQQYLDPTHTLRVGDLLPAVDSSTSDPSKKNVVNDDEDGDTTPVKRTEVRTPKEDVSILFGHEDLPSEPEMRVQADVVKRQSRLSQQIHSSISREKTKETQKKLDSDVFKGLANEKKAPIITQMRGYLGTLAEGKTDDQVSELYFNEENKQYRMLRDWNYRKYVENSQVVIVVDGIMPIETGTKSIELSGSNQNIKFKFGSAVDNPISLITFTDKGEDSVGVSVSPEGAITVAVADGVSGSFLPAISAREVAKRVARLGKKGPFDNAILSRVDAYLQTVPFLKFARQHIKYLKTDTSPTLPQWISVQKSADWDKQLFTGIRDADRNVPPRPELVSQTKLTAVRYEPASGKIQRAIKGDTSMTVIHSDGNFARKSGNRPDRSFMYIPDEKSTYNSEGDVVEEVTLRQGDLVLVHSDGFDPEKYVEEIKQFVLAHPGETRLDTAFVNWFRDNVKTIDDDITIAAIHHT